MYEQRSQIFITYRTTFGTKANQQPFKSSWEIKLKSAINMQLRKPVRCCSNRTVLWHKIVQARDLWATTLNWVSLVLMFFIRRVLLYIIPRILTAYYDPNLALWVMILLTWTTEHGGVSISGSMENIGIRFHIDMV